MTESEELELLELELLESQSQQTQQPAMQPAMQTQAQQPATRENFQSTPEAPGSMSDFSRMEEPNPDKWMARVPVDMAMAYGTGGLATAASKIPALIQHLPNIAKVLGYGGKALTSPKTFGQASTGGALEGVINESIKPDATLESVGQAASIGGVAGGVGDALLRPLVGGIKVDPRAQNLIDKGVDVTTGGRIGRGARNLEDKLMSTPILGDSIRGAKNRELDSFNRTLINDAVAPIGEKLPVDTSVGSDAILWADSNISDTYDDVLANMTVKPDNQFISEIDNLRSMSDSLPADEAKVFNTILDKAFDTRITGGGDMLLGETYKKVFRRVRDKAAKYSKSSDAFQQDLGAALGEVSSSFKELGMRQNPAQGKMLADADKSFAKMATIRKAAERVGADDNVINASQYLNSVAKGAKGKSYSQGRAFNQELAQDAKAVMAQKIPDSGTAGRLIASGLVGGGAMTNLPATAAALTPAIIGAGAYTKPGQELLNRLLFNNSNASRAGVGSLQGLLSASVANNMAE